MNFIEAIKTGKPIKRQTKELWDCLIRDPYALGGKSRGWMDPGYFLTCINIGVEDILAEDWEVKED